MRRLPPGAVAQPGHVTHTLRYLIRTFAYDSTVSNLHARIMERFNFPDGEMSVYWPTSMEREFNFSQPDQMIALTGLSPARYQLMLFDSVSLRRRRTSFSVFRRRRQKGTSILEGWGLNTLRSQ